MLQNVNLMNVAAANLSNTSVKANRNSRDDSFKNLLDSKTKQPAKTEQSVVEKPNGNKESDKPANGNASDKVQDTKDNTVKDAANEQQEDTTEVDTALLAMLYSGKMNTVENAGNHAPVQTVEQSQGSQAGDIVLVENSNLQEAAAFGEAVKTETVQIPTAGQQMTATTAEEASAKQARAAEQETGKNIVQETPEETKPVETPVIKQEESSKPQQETEHKASEKPVEKEAVKQETKVEAKSEDKSGEAAALATKAEKPEVEPIRVKVGEVMHVQKETFPQKVAEKVDEIIISGKDNVFEVQLEPANLGKMMIKVAFEGDKVSVTLLCNSSKTAEMLSENAKNIGAIIEANTGTQTTIQVQEDKESYLNQEKNPDQGNGQEEKQQQRNNKEQEAVSENFLQQMRLGILQSSDAEMAFM